MALRRKSKTRKQDFATGGGTGFFSLHARVWWWVALFLGVFPIAFRQVSVSDAWWHVALGRWIVEKRSLPDLSQFYFSPFDAGGLASELRWEWLGDIVFYLCHAAAGAAGLQWLVIGCVMAGLGFLAMLAAAPSRENRRPNNWGALRHQRRFVQSETWDNTAAIPPMDNGHGPWMLLLLVAVCLGTYQLQLARNSVFSLALYPAVLWLGLRKGGPPSWREYAVISGVLVLWSCLHGSCVLGWATAFVIFGDRAASAFRGGKAIQSQGAQRGGEKKRGMAGGYFSELSSGFQLRSGAVALAFFCGAFLISLGLVSAGRSGAVDFLLLPVRHLGFLVSAAPVGAANPAIPVSNAHAKPSTGIEEPGAISRTTQRSSLQQNADANIVGVKEWLNSSIWKPDPRTPWSNDYWSPFDMLPGMRPIEAAFALAIIAVVVMAWFRNVAFGFVLAWLGAVFLGAGYVRMFGYTALASGAAIVACTSGVRAGTLLRRCGWAAVGLWVALSWWALFNGKIETLIPEGQHVSRFGQVRIFDEATADWVKAEFPNEKVFTTIESGSFCLLRWGFEKPVFLDGFFAPHTREIWDAYHISLNSGDLSILHDQFGVTLAIIPTTSGPWVQRFRQSRGWNPLAIGAGTIVFAHQSIPLAGRSPQIFFTDKDLRNTSSYFRMATLREVFLTIGNAEGRDGFSAAQWTAHPSFQALHELGKDVFFRK